MLMAAASLPASIPSAGVTTQAIHPSSVHLPPSVAEAAANSHSQKDTTYTKIFVGGLPYHTTDKSLREHFEVFGEIEEAVVITDRQTGKSRGYGFVTMADRSGAERAIKDPNPVIDGRKANVNLAILGAKPRNSPAATLAPLQTAVRMYPHLAASAGNPYSYHPSSLHAQNSSFQAPTSFVYQVPMTHPSYGPLYQAQSQHLASAAAAAAAGGYTTPEFAAGATAYTPTAAQFQSPASLEHFAFPATSSMSSYSYMNPMSASAAHFGLGAYAPAAAAAAAPQAALQEARMQ